MRTPRPVPGVAMSAPRPIAGLAVFVAAIGVRVLPWREVIEPGRVVFFGNDAWYHARRIAYAFVHFPERLGHDAYLAFPRGAKAIWSPGFDASLAALARGVLGEPADGASLASLERFLVWVPPVLGAATVVVAIAVARRLFGRAEAAWTGAVLCVLPAHFWYTRIGFVDHHAAVALLSTASVAIAIAWHGAIRDGRPAPAIAWALGCGATLAGAVWTWPGAVLHVALVEIGVAWAFAASASRADARRAAWQLAGMNAFAAVLLAPSGWSGSWPQWSVWSPLVLSRFQPLAFAVAASGAVLCGLGWRWDAWGATRLRRVGSAGVVYLCVFALASVAIPALAEGVREAARWLLRDEPFQRLVGESLPLLSHDGAFSFAIAWRRFGPFVFAIPVAFAALALSARRHPERAILCVWSAGLFAATLFQRRFFATASVGFAIVMAAAVCHAWRAAGERRTARWAVGVAVAAAMLPLLVPYTDFVANEWRAHRGEPLRAGPAFGAARAGVAVADWLRSATPETDGWMQHDAEPAYGVLAPWHLGHVITYRGRRPTVVDNFGDDLGGENFAWARRTFAAPVEAAVAALRERRVRYVVVDADGRWLGREVGPGSLLRTLYEGDGADAASNPALAHTRLVHETRGAAFTRASASARYKVFERVAGAQVQGRAAPGAQIDATLEVSTSRGRRFTFAARTVADGEGVYRLRLPYATRGAPSGVRVAPLYRLRCGAIEAALAVDEPAVQEGLAIPGPAVCAASLTPSHASADENRDPRRSHDPGP